MKVPKFTKEQQLAVDYEGSNALVSAGAGSGKTAVLSQRVLRKVKTGTSVDNLLILTFTNAAALEMKERIRKIIGEEPELKDEFEKVASAYITTFDSFSLSVCKKFHYLKNLDKNIGICDSSILSIKSSIILDEIFTELYDSNNEDFFYLLNRYTFKNDNDLKEFISKTYKGIDLLFNKEEYLDTYMDYYYNSENIDRFVSYYEDLVMDQISILKNYHEESLLFDEKFFTKFSLKNLVSALNYDEVLNHMLELPRIVKGDSDEAKEWKAKASKVLKRLVALLKYNSLEEYKNDYLDNKKSVSIIIDIIKKYDEKIMAMKYRENIFDFLDIEKMAIELIRDNEIARNYYSNKFDEILIDEYQDTSDIQEEFIKLIAHNNVYMVGDIKQSIYRFRNANPDIFKDKFINYGELIGGTRIDLNKNFRSREEVLSNINLMFDYLMDLQLGGADYRKEHRLIFGNTTYSNEGNTGQNNDFEVLSYDIKEALYKKEEIEAFTIARDIKDKIESEYIIFDKDTLKQRPCEYKDFCILLDKGKHFLLYKKIFEFLGIPLNVYKDESVKESSNVLVFKNIFNLINKIYLKEFDTSFEYSFLSVGRSFLVEYSDEKLFKIIKNKKFYETELFKKCEDISKNLNVQSVYSIAIKIVEEFDFTNQFIKVKDVPKNMLVLEYILNICKNANDIYTIGEFIEYLDTVTDGKLDVKYKLVIDGDSGVSIMTIHRSKGLEFPICYFGGLYEKFNIRDTQERYLFDKKLGLIIPTVSDSLHHLFLREVYKNDFLSEEISEKLRLFYVALTRAKEKMIFVIPLKNDTENDIIEGVVNDVERYEYRSFQDFLESISSIIIPYVKDVDIDKLEISRDYNILKSASLENSKIMIPKLEVTEKEFIKEEVQSTTFSKGMSDLIDKRVKENIKKGLELHEIMENIDFNNIDLTNIPNEYKDIVENFINLDILNNTINHFKEYEFMYTEGDKKYHGIIDLLLEKENQFIVIDYKLKSVTSSEYTNQLKGYKEYIKSVSGKPTSCYLYSLVDKTLVEIK